MYGVQSYFAATLQFSRVKSIQVQIVMYGVQSHSQKTNTTRMHELSSLIKSLTHFTYCENQDHPRTFILKSLSCYEFNPILQPP